MKKNLCFLLSIIFICSVFLTLTPAYSANETVCRLITSSCRITVNGKKAGYNLTDGYDDNYYKYDYAKIEIEANEPVGGIYIKFDRTPPEWTISYNDMKFVCGKYGFLHEYQSIYDDNITSLTLLFPTETSISDMYVLSRGDKLPAFVQVWRPAEGPCDIMLLSCHSDDDQLFFAGSVPDAVRRGAEMQVCYFTNHWRSHKRPHELLNGLWTCGLDRYPVIGRFPDIGRVDTEEEMLQMFEGKGYTYEQMVEDQVELLRKYKPQIVLVHDINGEYGHGAHRLDSHSLRDAAVVSNDPTKYPESANKYGTWDVPKIYIHLYKENEIDFKIDVPLEYFGGKTAYQVSQAAFRCHRSQFSSRYKTWLLGTAEKPVTDSRGFPSYSPRAYGLWKTNVGADTVKNDFYENVVLLKDQQIKETAPPETVTDETETDNVTAQETTDTETDADTQTNDQSVTETEAETDETVTETQTDTENIITGTETESEEQISGKNNNTAAVVVIIICSACVIGAAAAVFAVIKKKSAK